MCTGNFCLVQRTLETLQKLPQQRTGSQTNPTEVRSSREYRADVLVRPHRLEVVFPDSCSLSCKFVISDDQKCGWFAFQHPCCDCIPGRYAQPQGFQYDVKYETEVQRNHRREGSAASSNYGRQSQVRHLLPLHEGPVLGKKCLMRRHWKVAFCCVHGTMRAQHMKLVTLTLDNPVPSKHLHISV